MCVEEMSRARDEYYKFKANIFLYNQNRLIPEIENYVNYLGAKIQILEQQNRELMNDLKFIDEQEQHRISRL